MTRKIINILSLSVLLLLVIPAGRTLAEGGIQTEGELYTVRLGDTWYTISTKFGVRAETLIDLNDLRARPDLLYVGEKIRLPMTVGFTPSQTSPYYYVAQTGDTVGSVLAATEVETSAFLRANYFDPNTASFTPLQPGLAYLIPPGPRLTTVQPGDTAQTIADRYGITVNTLLRFNPSLAGFIFTGQSVFIPLQYNVFSSTPTTTPPTTGTPPTGAPTVPAPSAPGATPPTGGDPATVTSGLQTTAAYYIVRRGDTLALISRKFGVSAALILDINNLRTRPDVLYVGEQILLPYTVGFTPSWVRAWYYVARPGDTVQTVLQATEIDRFAFAEANNLGFDLPRVAELTPGRAYLVPAGPHRAVITVNENLTQIAARYQTTVAQLLRFNPALLNGEYVGAPVYIPAKIINALTDVVATTPGTTTGGAVSGSVAGLNSPLEVRDVRINNATAKPGSPGVYTLTMAVIFRGGTGSYSLVNSGVAAPLKGPFAEGDDGQWSQLTFEVESTCGGLFQGSAALTSGGVTMTHPYTIGPVPCDN